MVKIFFDPVVVHRKFWERVNKTILQGGLINDPILQEKTSIQLLHCALEELFNSIPYRADAQFEDHLANVIDREKMIAILLAHRIIDEPEKITCRRSYVSHSDLATLPVGEETVSISVYPSNVELAAVAFASAYQQFVDDIDGEIKECCRQARVNFNSYFNVKVEPKVDARGKIIAILVELAGDIRHDCFTRQFPSGRYEVRD